MNTLDNNNRTPLSLTGHFSAFMNAGSGYLEIDHIAIDNASVLGYSLAWPSERGFDPRIQLLLTGRGGSGGIRVKG